MTHFVSIDDVVRNPDLYPRRGQFVTERPPGHVCLPECAEIGGEPESAEMYGLPAHPLDRTFTCAFCGSTKKPRGREHVLPDWLNNIGLEPQRVEYHVGWLNRVPRRWTSTPFTATVRAVCDDCNHGWMSGLEGAVKPILTPLILGEDRDLSADDERLISAWTFKTALVSLVSSSEDDRARGYGVPAEEYAALYSRRDHPEPLPYSQFWIGCYAGERPPGTIRVVPLVVELNDIPPPDVPAAYLITVLIGKLLVQGVRFTTPSLFVELATAPELPQIWPTQPTVAWPPDPDITDSSFERMLQGKALQPLHPGIRLVPFKPATELESSDIEGSTIKQPVPCGQHYIYFPAALAQEAMLDGKRYAFVAKCECDIAYLVVLESDGAHFRNDGTIEHMAEVIEMLDGDEYELGDGNGYFYYKELA